jgi:Uma2 family endonuclease
MGLPKLKTKISVKDYLENEKSSSIKHEFVEGEIFAMAGTSDTHNFIAGDIYATLLSHLKNSKCQPFIGDIKVQVRQNIYYYPDVLVSCEESPENPHFRNNPILVIEVTSKSTDRIDRREKVFFVSANSEFAGNMLSLTNTEWKSRFIADNQTAAG